MRRLGLAILVALWDGSGFGEYWYAAVSRAFILFVFVRDGTAVLEPGEFVGFHEVDGWHYSRGFVIDEACSIAEWRVDSGS